MMISKMIIVMKVSKRIIVMGMGVIVMHTLIVFQSFRLLFNLGQQVCRVLPGRHILQYLQQEL